ncbi:MAG: signal peptidase II [Ruminococcaceae bacterium]|nr:signal peptidase II [Oscillospiraceae bacterium]
MINILIAVVCILLDQGFKYLAVQHLKGQAAVTVIPGLIGLRYAENTGAAFSILSGKVDFLIIITAVALAVVAFFIVAKKFDKKIEEFCFVLIFAGGVGNLIDRIVHGKVVDYLEFLFIEFPIFNFADILVCCGVGLYAVYTVVSEFSSKKGKAEGTDD